MTFFTSRRKSEPEPEPEQREPESRPVPPPATSRQQPIGFETVLGPSTRLEGELISDGNIRLDGMFTGTLKISGNVLVGETAKITADINARNVSIAGAVRGNVSGNRVQLLRTGRVWGDIRATALTTEEGAFIDGKISMTSHEAAQAVASESEAGSLAAHDPRSPMETNTIDAEIIEDDEDEQGNEQAAERVAERATEAEQAPFDLSEIEEQEADVSTDDDEPEEDEKRND